MLPPALRELVIAEHGVVRRDVLNASGVAYSTISRQVRRGDWRPYGRGVLIAAWAPDDFQTRTRAALLSQPGHAATGLSAIVFYDTSPLRQYLPRGDVAWLVADRSASPLWRPVRHPDAQAVTRSGHKVLLEEDALIDMIRLMPFDSALDAVWTGLQERITTVERLQTKAAPLSGLAGRRQLRIVLEIISNGAKSSGEVRMITIVERAGMRGIPDYPLAVGDRRYRLDYAFPQVRLGLEFDGYRFHSKPTATQRDARRHNVITNAGWDLRYFTWRDVVETPHIVAEQAAQALQLRSSLGFAAS